MVSADGNETPGAGLGFQYSLCRVVLMVLASASDILSDCSIFQYSLCRVVLMVPET